MACFTQLKFLLNVHDVSVYNFTISHILDIISFVEAEEDDRSFVVIWKKINES
jgi:hypothetical protein